MARSHGKAHNLGVGGGLSRAVAEWAVRGSHGIHHIPVAVVESLDCQGGVAGAGDVAADAPSAVMLGACGPAHEQGRRGYSE